MDGQMDALLAGGVDDETCLGALAPRSQFARQSRAGLVALVARKPGRDAFDPAPANGARPPPSPAIGWLARSAPIPLPSLGLSGYQGGANLP
jgi:hypothetical protein